METSIKPKQASVSPVFFATTCTCSLGKFEFIHCFTKAIHFKQNISKILSHSVVKGSEMTWHKTKELHYMKTIDKTQKKQFTNTGVINTGQDYIYLSNREEYHITCYSCNIALRPQLTLATLI